METIEDRMVLIRANIARIEAEPAGDEQDELVRVEHLDVLRRMLDTEIDAWRVIHSH